MTRLKSFWEYVREAHPGHLVVVLMVSAGCYYVLAYSNLMWVRILTGVVLFLCGFNFAMWLLLPQMRAMTAVVEMMDPERQAKLILENVIAHLPPGSHISHVEIKPPEETRH